MDIERSQAGNPANKCLQMGTLQLNGPIKINPNDFSSHNSLKKQPGLLNLMATTDATTKTRKICFQIQRLAGSQPFSGFFHTCEVTSPSSTTLDATPTTLPPPPTMPTTNASTSTTTKAANDPLKSKSRRERLTSWIALHQQDDIKKWRRNLALSGFVELMYRKLLSLELKWPITEQHLTFHRYITPRMRAELLNWLIEVHFHLGLAQETLQMACALIDRYLAINQHLEQQKLKRLGITSLYIAAKYEQIILPPISHFAKVPSSRMSIKKILNMELCIFNALNYNLARPVPIHFLRRFSRLALTTDREHAMAKYLQELAITNYALVSYKPSQIAAASLFLAFHFCNRKTDEACGLVDSLWPPLLIKYSRCLPAQLSALARKIAILAFKQPTSELQASFHKYSTSRYYGVSKSNALSGPLIESIIKGERRCQPERIGDNEMDTEKELEIASKAA